jgi:hypothetical protein
MRVHPRILCGYPRSTPPRKSICLLVVHPPLLHPVHVLSIPPFFFHRYNVSTLSRPFRALAVNEFKGQTFNCSSDDLLPPMDDPLLNVSPPDGFNSYLYRECALSSGERALMEYAFSADDDVWSLLCVRWQALVVVVVAAAAAVVVVLVAAFLVCCPRMRLRLDPPPQRRCRRRHHAAAFSWATSWACRYCCRSC